MLTWEEFKDIIDSQLAERGLPESTDIWFIDVVYPEREDFEGGKKFNIRYDRDSGIGIG